MNDLVQRLRAQASAYSLFTASNELTEAADAIARKDAEIAALKLERDDFANACEHSADDLRARDAEIADLGRRYANAESKLAFCDAALHDMRRAKDAEIAELREELDGLRQACWDARAILGFDNDGDTSPEVLVYPTMAELVLRDAKEFRADYDAALREAERAEARVAGAPVVEAIRNSSTEAALFARDLPAGWIGKRVALVLLDTEEAK